jgi:polyvinyl alcohol dehydrogenase (cytochrome)
MTPATSRPVLLLGVCVALAAPGAVIAAHAAPTAPRVAAASTATCAPRHSPGGEWRSYGHDLANTRSQPRERVITPLKAATLQKSYAFSASQGGGDGDFTGTPIIADGCLFIGSNTGWVFAANADTGKPVWSTNVGDGYGINSTPLVKGGRVYVGVSAGSGPEIVSLDQRTGAVKWHTRIDHQSGADVYGSPVIFDGVLFIGVSGGAAELGDSESRDAFQGAFLLIETRGPRAGTILRKTYTVQPPQKNAKQGGATVWSTPAIDPRARVAYVGTGNPFHPETHHPHADAIIKVDLDRRHRSFGRIIGAYAGTVDEYQDTVDALPCYDIPGNPAPYYPQGIGACGDIDLDFGAAPNLIRRHGRVLVGDGQKSGVYHLIDGRTMKGVWHSIVGPPSQFGGVVGSTAYDGHNIYGPQTLGGYVWSLDGSGGGQRWVAPVADGAHWGNPVAQANGVVYTVGLTGVLDAYDASTGVPVLHHPMAADVDRGDLAASWGGVSIARNTVYAAIGMTGLPDGTVVAYRPGGTTASANTPTTGPPSAEILSGPQGQSYGYLTPVAVVSRTGTLTYTNVDIVRHNVVQDVRADNVHGSRRAPWCTSFRRGQCPLFWSKLVGLSEQAPVLGLKRTKPGTYHFYCTLHPGMKGTLVVTS